MAQYATLQEAENYFATRLHSGAWSNYSSTDRTAALVTATRAIDRLNFQGEKAAAYTVRQGYNVRVYTDAQEQAIADAGATQALQFPRGSDTEIPEPIKLATCEEAFELIQGRSTELEMEALGLISQGFSNIRNTKDQNHRPDNLLNGIVSSQAWLYLLPFLRNSNDFKIKRV